MEQVRRFRAFGLAAITLMLGLTLAAQGDTTAIQQKLYSQFKLTTITADRSDIVTAGDVVAINKPGLVMYAVASPMPPSNTYKNGKIGQGWGGFGKDLAISMSTSGGGTAADYPHRPFAPEEKCWVTGIQVQNDGVLFQLYSDPYDDIRYYANLKIPFPNKKQVPPVDAAMQLVAEVLTVVPQDDQGAQQSQDTQQTAFSGMYANQNPNSTERFLFLSDGTFTKFVGNGQGHGKFGVNGDTLTLTTASGASYQLNIQGDNLINPSTRQVFVRTGDASASAEAPAAPLQEIAAPPPPPSFQGTYFRKNKASDTMELGPNGVFALVLHGQMYEGNYTVQGEDLTVWGPKIGQHKFSLVGNVIKGLFAIWEKPVTPPNVATTPATSPLLAPEPAPAAVPTPASAPEPAQAAAPAPAPMQAIAPPPPPSDATPPTITVGQTRDQVIAGFGQPVKAAKIGVKEIFYYKDMKVTFTNGKVTNVE